MKEPRRIVYLERSSYRRRRARDASRLLPFLFLVIFLVPGLWRAGEGEIVLSDALVFIFFAWIIAIAIAALLSRYLVGPIGDDQQANEPDRTP